MDVAFANAVGVAVWCGLQGEGDVEGFLQIGGSAGEADDAARGVVLRGKAVGLGEGEQGFERGGVGAVGGAVLGAGEAFFAKGRRVDG